MSEDEVVDFKRRVPENKDLFSDFHIYHLIVKAIYKKEKNEGVKLDMHSKSLSKDYLRKIVSTKTTLVKGGGG